MTASTASRLDRLLGFLEQDAANLSLIAEAASAAIDENRPELIPSLVQRYAKIAPPTAALRNLSGLAALRESRIDEAREIFAQLLAEEHQDPALRFNLAWCLALGHDWTTVDTLLDSETLSTTPEAARLKLQALHHLARLDEALALGEQWIAAGRGSEALLGALTTIALDAEAFETAERYAAQIPGTLPGLTTQGMLALNAERADRAGSLFEDALRQAPGDGRAQLGMGLSLLSQGEHAPAARWLDQAAETFGDHLGSWVAAGWAHFVVGDLDSSRTRFEAALALDETFSEAHGGLAVIDLLQGAADSAEQRARRAMRLDRAGFGGALATSMLADQRGDAQTAQRIRETALNAPAGPGGRTILQSMSSIGARRR
ncbi:tetratricopeptide repeat protein [Caulobacter sp. DWR1-3-2b1]|uniref:tetratricopeptide repeat protein n=1 Tax=Caulobacter sp. DWR1-3-2b1 TaxID=2804670 RepID=UPI003CEA30B6